MNHYIVYDIETQKLSNDVPNGWNNIYGMGVGSTVTYDSQFDRYQFWTDRELLCKYLNGKYIVGFNSINFDSKVLLGDNRIIELNGITKNDKYWWYNIDIYVEMWRNIFNMDKSNYLNILKKMKDNRIKGGVFNLDAICKATLNVSKSGKGELAPLLYQQKRFAELFEYNLQDTRLTKELFLFIKKYRYLVTGEYDIVRFN